MTELPHGRTLDELGRIARHIARTQRGLIIDTEEAVDVATVALVEHLYADPAPTDADLFQVARHAVAAANHREYSFAGLDANTARSGREGVPRGFARYWDGQRALAGAFEDDVVERIAVRQVIAALRPINRETLEALAEHGSYESASIALGITRKGWAKRIAKARRQARELWYWPEPAPAQLWGGRDFPGLNPDAKARNRGLLHLARKRWNTITKESTP